MNLNAIKWPTLIDGLIDSGFSTNRIASLTGTHASTISRLRRGAVKEPYWSLGDKLLSLASLAEVSEPDEVKTIVKGTKCGWQVID